MKYKHQFFNRRIDNAIIFAAKAHKNQFRKTDPSIPYIYHPVSVGFILRRAGFSDDVVIAGILHDVIEDCGKTVKELRDIFGKKVSFLVEKVSENKKLPWEKRKEEYLRGVINAPAEVKAISVADKLQNIQSIIIALEKHQNIWKFFNRNKKMTIEHYVHFVKTLKQKWHHPLLKELEASVKYLEKEAEVK